MSKHASKMSMDKNSIPAGHSLIDMAEESVNFLPMHEKRPLTRDQKRVAQIMKTGTAQDVLDAFADLATRHVRILQLLL